MTEEVKGKVKETYHDDQTTVVEGHRRLTVTKQAQYHSTDSFFINSRDQLQLTSANASFLTVEAQGLHENIKGGHVSTIEGGHHTTVKTGNWKIDVPAGNANIKCIDGKLETAGKWNEFVSGDHIKVTMNATSETLIGLKNENFIGGKLGITIGYQGEVFVGVKHELSASVNSSINLGIRAELSMVDTKELAVNNMTVGMTLSAIATKIRAHGTRLSPAGFTIM